MNTDPEWSQYVAPEKYRQNLISILTSPVIAAQSPKIILITPPPVEETTLLSLLQPNDSGTIRLAKDAAAYAQIVRDIGAQYNIPVLDVWTLFMEKAGWKVGEALPGSKELGKNAVLAELLSDGEFLVLCDCVELML